MDGAIPQPGYQYHLVHELPHKGITAVDDVRDTREATMTDPRDLSYATEDEMLAKEVAAEVRGHRGHDIGRDEVTPDRTAPTGAGSQEGTAPPIEADPRDVDGTTADVELARGGRRERASRTE